MPELLEIEVYRGVAELVVGRTVAAVHADDSWYLKGGLSAEELHAGVTGETIVAARRHGKLLLLETSGPVLGLRFGMTGRLLVDGAAGIDRLEYSSDRDLTAWDRFGLDFAGGGTLTIGTHAGWAGSSWIRTWAVWARMRPRSGRRTCEPCWADPRWR